MMLWRWDHAAGDWQPDLLRPGTLLPLGKGKDALLFPSGPHARCALLTCQGGATVNGLPALPLRILADRDAIEVEGETVYFTLDAPPEVVAFAAQAQVVGCARCKGALREGEQGQV